MYRSPTTIGFRLPNDEREELFEMAAQRNITPYQLVRDLTREWMATERSQNQGEDCSP
jgi:hypothetical protein